MHLSPQSPLCIEFQLTTDEFVEASFAPRRVRRLALRAASPARMRDHRIAQRASGSALIGLLLVGAAAEYLTVFVAPLWIFLFTFPLLIFFLCILALRRKRRQVREKFESDPHHRLPVTFMLDDAGVHCASEQIRYDLPWDHIGGVEQTRNLLIILDTDLTFYVIPKRAFAAADQREAFLNVITRRAKGGASSANR